MLKIFSYISFGFAALLVLLFLGSMRPLKKKSAGVRKKFRLLRRLYAGSAALFLVAGGVLQLLAMPKADLRAFINSSSPVEAYQQSLKNQDAERACDYLPRGITAVEDDYYITTGKGKTYGHLAFKTVSTDVYGAEMETISYRNGLSYENAAMVSGGEGFLAFLDRDGKLSLSGAFEYLQYERDDTTFEKKVFSRQCSFIDGNSNNLFYISEGDLYSMGYNAFGLLGDGTERNRIEGAMILENVDSVSVSETHTLAVDAYGNLYGFGSNSYSEMGNRTTAASSTPIKLMSGVRQAEAGRNFSIVLTKNGMVYAAGRNHRGQLGTNDNRDYANYQKVLEGIVKISVSGNSCAALSANGTLYVWGENANGQLGLAGETVLQPAVVATDVYDVAMGRTSMGVIKLNRDVYVTGTARLVANDEAFQAVYQFAAEVPANRMYREVVSMPIRPENS